MLFGLQFSGNPQAVGQPPITFFRQVLALTDLDDAYGINHPEVHRMFPADVVTRASKILEILDGVGTGAYTGSQGALGFRKEVATFIQERDGGHPAYPGNIFLSNGASSAIEAVLTAIMSTAVDGGEQSFVILLCSCQSSLLLDDFSNFV